VRWSRRLSIRIHSPVTRSTTTGLPASAACTNGSRRGSHAPPAAYASNALLASALTHARPYKPAWPVRDAIAEIDRQRGRQFDPAIVDAFMRVIEAQLEVGGRDDVVAGGGEVGHGAVGEEVGVLGRDGVEALPKPTNVHQRKRIARKPRAAAQISFFFSPGLLRSANSIIAPQASCQ